ncbi:MAG TPA: murein biosynthesis integral membrane protein MurJ [Candidatus Woesebacteria bacterium]|nr:murein biosynthesis integral membrane protein MurJ [Candidatus Woesebacteria bacterium]
MLPHFTLPKILLNNSWLEKQQTSILSAAFVITAANVLSSLIGLVRERLLITYFFDEVASQQALEAFQIAFQIPDALFQLLVLGALSAAFIPIFTDEKGRSELSAFAMTSSVMNLILLAFIVISAITYWLAYPITLWRTGNAITPEQITIIVNLTRIMLVAQLFFAISNFFSGMLQSYQRFVLPAVAPILYNLGIMLGVVLLYERLGIYSAGVGVVLGAVIHMGVQLPAINKIGYRHRLIIDLKINSVKKLLAMMPPRVATFAVSEIQNLSLGFFATSLGNLSFFIIRLAMRLMTIPIRLFGVPIGQASLAFLSEKTREKDLEKFTSLLTTSLHQIAFFAFPASVLLLILRIPVVRLVFGAHNLPWETTVATGKAVAIVALSIVAQCLVQLMIRAFHALKDTKTPFLIALLTTFFYLVGCFVIIKFSSLGINGIATIISLTAVLELSLFVIFLERKIGNFTTKNLFVPQAKMLVAAFLMSVFLYLPFKVLDELVFETSRTIELIGLTVVTSTIGLLVYLYLAYLLNIHELQIVRKVLQSIGSWRKSLTRTPEVMIETTQDDGIV